MFDVYGGKVMGGAMFRPLRIESLDAWYHVMNRRRCGEDIFSADGDYDLFVHL